MAFIISASESGMGDRTGQCSPLQAPVIGTLKLVSGNGTSVGSVMSLQCPNTHRAVSSAQLSCLWSRNGTHWSGGTLQCKPFSRLEDESFRLAVLVSFISATLILLMSIIFITSCLMKCVKREERRRTERARKNGASEVAQHNQKPTNNNNSNNNNYTQLTATSITTDNPIYSPCRCPHEGKPCPQTTHPSQISAERLINTHTGAGHTHLCRSPSGPDTHTGAGHTHLCRPLLQEPVWAGHTHVHHTRTNDDFV